LILNREIKTQTAHEYLLKADEVYRANIQALEEQGVAVKTLEKNGYSVLTHNGDIRVMTTADEKAGFLLVEKTAPIPGLAITEKEEGDTVGAFYIATKDGQVAGDKITLSPETDPRGQYHHLLVETSGRKQGFFDAHGGNPTQVVYKNQQINPHWPFDWYGKELQTHHPETPIRERKSLTSIKLI
jgi:hypothetical protein